MAAIHRWDPGVMWTKSLGISPNLTLILMSRVAFASSLASFLPAWLNYLGLEFTAPNRACCCGWAFILCCWCCFKSTLDALFHIQVHAPESVSLQMCIQLSALQTHWQSFVQRIPSLPIYAAEGSRKLSELVNKSANAVVASLFFAYGIQVWFFRLLLNMAQV